jgi:hypothetical protein
MFKRAMKSNHWMAIGLEKWNELENMEITPQILKKMRKLKDQMASDSEDDDASDNFSDGDLDAADVDSEASSSNSIEEEDAVVEEQEGESDDSSEPKEPVGNFVFCPICPGRKFLTQKDADDHMKSTKHVKREKAIAASQPLQVDSSIVVKEKKKKEEKSKIEPSTPSGKLNRKARRANLKDTRNRQ